MKRFIKTTVMVMITVLGLASCEQETNLQYFFPYFTTPTYVAPGTTNSNGQNAITFSGYDASSAKLTRAYVNTLSNTGYDDFSLYVWTKDSTVIDNYHTTYVSQGWTYVGVDGQQLKYFDNFVNEYNFIGVIPQTDASLSDGSVTVSTESFKVDNESSTDTPKEFLFATAKVEKSGYPQGVTMNFRHGNAKVYLMFTSNDAETEIIDYAPSTEGYNVYTMTATTVPMQGPKLSSLEISDEDIEYVNSHYTATKGFSNYQTQNKIEGDLSADMYGYLVSKYPSLATVDKQRWTDYLTNANMKLIHIDREGVDNSYRGVFVNVQSVNWQSYTVSGTQGVKGVVVLPAISQAGDGSDAVLSSYVSKADATVSLEGLTWNITDTEDSLTFSKPTTRISSSNPNSPIASPTTWYALPCNTQNVGYTVKLSYVYKGVSVYDARVFIPSSECQWQEGKIYKYVIQINGRGNGHSEPNDVGATDPVVVTASPNIGLRIFKVEFSEYEDTEPLVKEIK